MRNQSISDDGSPPQKHRLIRRLLPKFLHPWARGVRKRWLKQGYRNQEPYKWTYSYTQASAARQEHILHSCQRLIEMDIPGAFVECGVLDGGTAALMAYAARKDARQVHLFDAWKGLPAASAQDGPGARRWVDDVVGSPRRVTKVMKAVGARMDQVIMHKGWFHETFRSADIEEIAFLHIDCDFYEPVRLCLNMWWPKMVKGGIVQIDDYEAFQGCRAAVDEFLAANPALRLVIEDRPGGAMYIVNDGPLTDNQDAAR